MLEKLKGYMFDDQGNPMWVAYVGWGIALLAYTLIVVGHYVR